MAHPLRPTSPRSYSVKLDPERPIEAPSHAPGAASVPSTTRPALCVRRALSADTLPAMKITGAYTESLLKAASIQRARAAGVATPRPAATSVEARAAGVRDVATVQGVSFLTPSRAADAAVPAEAAARIERIVAATVPGRVDFDDASFLNSGSLSVGGGLSIYSRPSDRNAAATGVSVGRALDIQG